MPEKPINSEPRTLFRSDDYRLDYFSCGMETDRIVFTFTERTNRQLDGFGFGGKFVLDTGCDLVAVKTRADRWYQDFPAGAVERVLESLGDRRARRVGYGSSMGAWAAIAFSRTLGFDAVLALSPQVDITQPWDRRWAREAAALDAMRPLDAGMISRSCRYFVAYDPFDLDRLHVGHLLKIIGPEQLTEIRVPFSGHPSGFFLSEISQLKPIAQAVFRDEQLPAWRVIMRARRALLSKYLMAMGQRCMASGKHRAARNLLARAFARAPLDPDVNINLAMALEHLCSLDEAIRYASTAVGVWPVNPNLAAVLARLLSKTGRHQAAAVHLEAAVAAAPDNAVFRTMLDEVRTKL